MSALQELWQHPWARALSIVLIGLPALTLLARFVSQRVGAVGGAHVGLIVSRVITTVGGVGLVLAAAHELGIDLTALLATAGVVTVAVGFAAQTSLSNLIAGLFLLVDRPFQVGDVVEIEGRIGMIESVTLLSTHVRTLENLRVRWPNEVVLKATIVNYTRYPVRRIDLRVRLQHGSDLGAAQRAVAAAVGELEQVLLDPPPEVLLRGYLDVAVELEVRAWMDARDVLAGRSALVRAVHDALVGAHIPVVGAAAPAPVSKT